METTLSVLLTEKQSSGQRIESTTSKQTVYDCAVQLAKLSIGALLVIDEGHLVGIISERDVLKKVVAVQADSKKILVENIMTRELVTVSPTTTVTEAMRIVTDKRIRHLPVMANGQLIGVISIGDLTKWTMLQQEQEISSLTSYIRS